MTTTEAEQVTVELVKAYERGDIDAMVACFAEDAVFRAGPMRPAVGKPAIRTMLTEWFSTMTVISNEIRNILSDGETVMQERTDRWMIGGREEATPTAVVFEVDHGLITACREYFDMPHLA